MIHDCSKWDFSLPCKELARSVGLSINVIHNIRHELGITKAKMRCIPDGEQPNDHKLIRCKHGQIAKVSNEDYDRVKIHCWTVDHSGYVWCRMNKKRITLHHFVAGKPDTESDHINRDRLDNQRHNLRTATHVQNNYNKEKKSGSDSRFKGVKLSHCKSKPWRVYVGRTHIGYFSSEEEAAKAYDKHVFAKVGKFARLNFQ